MRLDRVLEGIVEVERGDIDVKDIKIDSRLVQQGDLFIALVGQNFDGREFVREALDRGACIVLSEEELPDDRVIKVDSTRQAYALVSKNFFDKACDKLKLVAVTGTNGKTTTSYITKEVLSFSGLRTGIIGTLGAGMNEIHDTGFTTPDPYLLHKLFKQMLDEGAECVVMEASAHALALNKLDGIKFDVGILTNITEDHLDFFGDMESYAKAKFSLFTKDRVKLGIVCCDDLYGRRLLANGQVPMLSYGLGEENDITASDIHGQDCRSQFLCKGIGRDLYVDCPLVGDYNIQNILACVGVCKAFGVPDELISVGLSVVNQVEGRFNVVQMGGVKIIIDFAHTPDGLEKVLTTARGLTAGKLKVVFGCGGNRDRAKRRIMGKVAMDFADEVCVTSDNPRFEKPGDIIGDIVQDMEGDYLAIPDRKEAIGRVLQNAQAGDTVVIAGKGAEKYQEINGEKIPYNDFDEVYSFYRNQIQEVENA